MGDIPEMPLPDESQKLREALAEAQAALALLVTPGVIKNSTVLSAYATCVAVEAKARRVLSEQGATPSTPMTGEDNG